jgi:orotidine-5'-phosphate decarboxylase
MNTALAKLDDRMKACGSLLCVGLDPEISRLAERFVGEPWPLFAFNKWVIEQTAEFAAAYKPNIAFYEARGAEGLRELELTMEYLRAEFPRHFTICDAKRADIGNTNRGYVEAMYDRMGFDAVTLHPYLGREALLPFLEREDKVSIILCRTSNAGAGEFQDLQADGEPLWASVARKVSGQWNSKGNCMLVVGATYPREMQQVREIAPAIPLLVPGVGAQGGDVAATVRAGQDGSGRGLLIASSRAIIFAAEPRQAAREMRDEIRRASEAAHAAR